MKVYEKIYEIEGWNYVDIQSMKDSILSKVYSVRKEVPDLFDYEKYKSLHKTVDWFLDNDLYFDGDNYSEWERFLELDVI